MQKVKLIYNPYSGTRTFPNYLDLFFKKFQAAGYEIDIYRSMEENDLHKGLVGLDDSYKYIIVAGGDGTVNEIVNNMMEKDIDIPLGIIPSGTVNDFASFLGMTQNIENSVKRILDWNIKEIDVGKVNDKYFLNVCVGGIISQIAHGTETEMKNRLGKVAYYLQGLRELPNIKSMQLKIETSKKVIEGDFLGFFIFNSNRNFTDDGLKKLGEGFKSVTNLKCLILNLAWYFIKNKIKEKKREKYINN